MTDEAIERVCVLADERGLINANLGMFEVNGTYRSKRYNVRHLKKAMSEGIPWLRIPSGLDPADRVIETSPLADPERGFADGLLRMDPESCRAAPLDSGGDGLLLIGHFVDETAAYCPRALLVRELDRLAELGFELYGGFELEGALLVETPESIVRKRASEVVPVPGFERVYSYSDQTRHASLLDEISKTCAMMGLPLDTIHAEFVNMLEVGLQPATGVRIADNAGLYKAVAKSIASRQDMLLSFMARRSEAEQGAGAHINVSLRKAGTREAVFPDAAADDRMSLTMRQFLGGLSRFLPDLFVMLAPNLNSYKRFAPGLFTPLNNSWAINNKTVALRVINSTPAATRIEMRMAGADVSAHLGLLAVAIAGRLGIEQNLVPPAPVTGNGWAAEGQPPLPLDFAAAIQQFERSEVARTALGDDFVEAFAGDRRWQIDQFGKVVTDWELAMFGNC